jgi:rhodanese-related sulfurtransferase
VSAPAKRRTLDELLAAAEATISRHTVADAHDATAGGAVLIDIRETVNRERDGIVPGSLHIPLTVLEWRVAPDAPSRNPHVPARPDTQLILMCDHGYSSVLAAATLVALGFENASDVVGGFAAWQEAGLPTAPAPTRRLDAGEPGGMNGPDH